MLGNHPALALALGHKLVRWNNHPWVEAAVGRVAGRGSRLDPGPGMRLGAVGKAAVGRGSRLVRNSDEVDIGLVLGAVGRDLGLVGRGESPLVARVDSRCRKWADWVEGGRRAYFAVEVGSWFVVGVGADPGRRYRLVVVDAVIGDIGH